MVCVTIENNRNLFLVNVGLLHTGADAYDHGDAEISALAKRIYTLVLPDAVKEWFARARTGQVEINPYWPRGSALAAACFFVESGIFDIDAFLTFFEDAAIPDPVGAEDFRVWVAGLPGALAELETHPALPPLWDEYRRIADSRAPAWSRAVDDAIRAVQDFFGEDAPAMDFAPNMFACYSTDFARVGSRIITIAAAPDAESMLHETPHATVALHRDRITAFAEVYGLAGFADREKMLEFGYMTDDSAASVAHVIEECFVRAVAVILAGKGEERLRVHAEYGCDSIPFIASRFKTVRPSAAGFGEFIDAVLAEMIGQNGGAVYQPVK